MDVKIREVFESVGSFFTGDDHIPWCDRDIINGCEREVAEAAEVNYLIHNLCSQISLLLHPPHLLQALAYKTTYLNQTKPSTNL
uniref:Uncharacterized protein n=1 Tax=Salix viminalis TaxID=40686 RepID=A0A6N2N537_SALVM